MFVIAPSMQFDVSYMITIALPEMYDIAATLWSGLGEGLV
jgi:hypothetical protein